MERAIRRASESRPTGRLCTSRRTLRTHLLWSIWRQARSPNAWQPNDIHTAWLSRVTVPCMCLRGEGRRYLCSQPSSTGRLQSIGRVTAGRHPSAMTLSRDGKRLFVASGSTDRIAVIDTRSRRVITTLEDPPPAGPHEGSTPNALALSEDGKKLFVAEADNNAVAVFNLSPATAGLDDAAGALPAPTSSWDEFRWAGIRQLSLSQTTHYSS